MCIILNIKHLTYVRAGWETIANGDKQEENRHKMERKQMCDNNWRNGENRSCSVIKSCGAPGVIGGTGRLCCGRSLRSEAGGPTWVQLHQRRKRTSRLFAAEGQDC